MCEEALRATDVHFQKELAGVARHHSCEAACRETHALSLV